MCCTASSADHPEGSPDGSLSLLSKKQPHPAARGGRNRGNLLPGTARTTAAGKAYALLVSMPRWRRARLRPIKPVEAGKRRASDLGTVKSDATLCVA